MVVVVVGAAMITETDRLRRPCQLQANKLLYINVYQDRKIPPRPYKTNIYADLGAIIFTFLDYEKNSWEKEGGLDKQVSSPASS